MDAKKALENHPTATEVHVNKDGAYLFCPKTGVPASFGEFDTIKKGAKSEPEIELTETKEVKSKKK